MNLTQKAIEDVKVRTCFVTTMERAKKLNTEDAPAPPPSVKYFTSESFMIPGETREKVFEVLWERDMDNLSLPTMILNAIIKVSFYR